MRQLQRVSSLLLALSLLIAQRIGAIRIRADEGIKGFKAASIAADMASPRPPVFPKSYEMQYVLTLPYVGAVQTAGLKYPVHMWYDAKGRRVRVEVYNGMDAVYILPDTTYNVFARINKKVCAVANTSTGPMEAADGARLTVLENALSNPLPNLANWTFAGVCTVNDVAAYTWQLVEKHQEKVNTYTFYTSQHSDSPLKLYMLGVNLFTGSHFDEYIVEFSIFRRLSSAAQTPNFKPPYSCNHPITLHSGLLCRVLLIALPSTYLGASGPKPKSASGRGISAAPKFQRRLTNAQLPRNVDWRGTGADGFVKDQVSCGSCWTFGATGTMQGAWFMIQSNAVPKFHRGLTNAQPPRNVDWKDTGADAFVKDQVSCGSCWTFGATGTMQGAWFMATGEAVSLSEQQFVDCSWEFGSDGCMGGFAEDAISMAVGAHGASFDTLTEFINKTAKAAFFTGYEVVELRDELALMEAVYTQGPVGVYLDAGHPTFKYYSEGVYHREDCERYWLIRNSWSKFWGMDGYAKITRHGNDCGITTQPILAVVEPESAARAKAAVKAQAKASQI
eukprot:gene9940-7810_t